MRPDDRKRTQMGAAMAMTAGWMIAWTLLLLFVSAVGPNG